MIITGTLRTKAANRYRDVLQQLLRGDPAFPLHIRLRLPSPSAPIQELRAAYAAIRFQSRDCLPYGYSVDWQTVNTRAYGENQIPLRLYFAAQQDFFTTSAGRMTPHGF